MVRKLVLSLTLVLWSSSAFAHHPFDAQYDRNKPVTLSGTATGFRWINPHSSLSLNVRDSQGKVTSWVVELGSVEALTKAGWSKDSIEPGAQVSVQGWQAKDGTAKANARSVTIGNGPALPAGSSYDAQGPISSQRDRPAGTSGRLPGTSMSLPLAALFGALALMGAATLSVLRKETQHN